MKRELLGEVRERIERATRIESLLIFAVTAFYLSVVSWYTPFVGKYSEDFEMSTVQCLKSISFHDVSGGDKMHKSGS